MERVDVLGLGVDCVTASEVLEKIDSFVSSGKAHHIITANAEYAVLAQKDQGLARISQKASLVTADGVGIIWAGKFLSIKTSKNKVLRFFRSIFQAIYTLFALIFYKRYLYSIIPKRVVGSDLIYKISEQASKKGYKVFLLGGSEGVAEQAEKILKEKYNGLEVVGTYAGSPQETEKQIKIINDSSADILFVAWGQPKQEKWIKENLHRFTTVRVAIGVGGAFDHVTGKQKRAPKVFQKMGIEWLWRLITQPKRIVRVFKAVPVFIFKVVKWKIAHDFYKTTQD